MISLLVVKVEADLFLRLADDLIGIEGWVVGQVWDARVLRQVYQVDDERCRPPQEVVGVPAERLKFSSPPILSTMAWVRQKGGGIGFGSRPKTKPKSMWKNSPVGWSMMLFEVRSGPRFRDNGPCRTSAEPVQFYK